jgi:hypothetical protein
MRRTDFQISPIVRMGTVDSRRLQGRCFVRVGSGTSSPGSADCIMNEDPRLMAPGEHEFTMFSWFHRNTGVERPLV